ncbi:MAG: ATP-binding protein [Woeseiaceae bacterium]|nr:ATP-binding protein [Woeseiaceae bacterium]
MDTMLLKQMIASPMTSSELLVYDPFQSFDRESLVREVIGLANASVDGPRNILFGVNPGGVNGAKIVGISDSDVGDLKRAHRLISDLVEPMLDLAFIFDRIDGKLVGALEIGGCEFGPYFLAQDLSDELRRGACWQRDGRTLVATDRRELLNGHTQSSEEIVPAALPDNVRVSVGFNDDPDCEFIEVAAPDSSNPPFADEGANGETSRSRTIAQTLKDTMRLTTQMLNIIKTEQPSDDASSDVDDAGKEVAEAARKHYFYEECAAKVDLCIRNNSDTDIEGLDVEIGMPRMSGVDVADRIYTSPFDKRSANGAGKQSYPDVEHEDDAIFVRTTIASIAANDTRPLLGTSLRFAVGNKALGRKLALRLILRAADGRRLHESRVKIRFTAMPAEATDEAS